MVPLRSDRHGLSRPAPPDDLLICVLCIPGQRLERRPEREISGSHGTEDQSVRAYNDGNTQLLIDLNVFMTWADAVSQNDMIRANAVASRFSSEFKPAFKAWIAEAPGRPQEQYQTAPPSGSLNTAWTQGPGGHSWKKTPTRLLSRHRTRAISAPVM